MRAVNPVYYIHGHILGVKIIHGRVSTHCATSVFRLAFNFNPCKSGKCLVK